jgi:RimJ/RimL family protein N-acetyltransferase
MQVTKTTYNDISGLRSLFLQEANFQFIHNKCHQYGWADVYLCSREDAAVGYGSIWGLNDRDDRDAIFEFFLVASERNHASAFFRKLIDASGATHLETQTNNFLLTSMCYEFAKNIKAEAILFEDAFQTDYQLPPSGFIEEIECENKNSSNKPFRLMIGNELIASGGMMLNYNFPYADIYYDVNENHRRKGFGAVMAQELKKATYAMGRVPAARCNIHNQFSKSTLLKAGFRICGWLLSGEIIKG